VNQNI